MSKFCANCGQQIEDGTTFCPSCGAATQNNAPAEQTSYSVESNPVQTNNPYNNNPNNMNGMGYNQFNNQGAGTAWSLGSDKALVNKIAYGILAILLGGLGVHKFFAGKIGWGIAYLLLCWTGIPAILALVEGIIGLTTASDEKGNIYA
ncbi:MAG: zinc-ribbon domain and TM2 domain-containing protein [Anaerovibrio sp.]|uniref:TM2 domain-containing protein n=1 Tax=Anaerovibrio sp. TaxID=1872532 RepID=UPI0025B7E727|nr:zinc-ribbon domain and TM2 domain-containing protein [Anaerovibrio sp.]MBE6098891.1 zinc-ribbon domain and TM2 domain-containing protein [Anaerovibrio sp.]